MQQFIETITSKLGISESVASSATGNVLDFVKENVGGSDFSSLLEKLPGASDLVGKSAEEAAPDTGGGLMSGLSKVASSVVGGQAGDAANLMGKLQESGLDAEQSGSFVTQIMGFIKDKAGSDLVEKLAGQIPLLKQFLG